MGKAKQYEKIIFVYLQLGIHGVCQSSYAVEENSNAKELKVTQMVDITNCQQPAALYRGMALAPEDKLSKQVCFITFQL